MEEADSRGVLNSACSRSVAGTTWIGEYTNKISPDFATSLKLEPSKKVYQFGGGEKRVSRGSLKLPAVIGDKKVHISVEIVEARIPLLIGSNSMVAGGALLDFQKFKAVFFDENVPMHRVGTGHFCIDLLSEYIETHINDIKERDEVIEKILVAADNIDIKGLKKLHHLYGHTSADKLLKFLRKAGKDTKEISALLHKIEATCDACIKSKRRKPRPKTALPRVESPNQIVSIDLKVCDDRYSGKYICYLIDMYSRFTAATFIKDKKPDTIVCCIMQQWVSLFGLMGGLHSDIGGEMSNEIMEDVAHKLGIKSTTTSSYSPHQNGLNERNHAVVDLMVTRMMASDKTLSSEMALRWALNAKNSLENYHGFSPYQLHIGRNPIMPSVTRDGPSSYETECKSESFAANLNAMHSARQEFTQAECSTILKKALKSKIHPRGEDISKGDWIYFKKNDGKSKSPIWSGPSQVAAINGKKLFIDRGARLATVNRDDAVRMGEEFWKIEDIDKEVGVEKQSRLHQSKEADVLFSEGESLNEETSTEEESSEDENDVLTDEESVSEVEDEDEADQDEVPRNEVPRNGSISTTNESGERSDLEIEANELVQEDREEDEERDEEEGGDVTSRIEAENEAQLPNADELNDFLYTDIRTGQIIQYRIPETNKT